jgi:hypothetical protein
MVFRRTTSIEEILILFGLGYLWDLIHLGLEKIGFPSPAVVSTIIVLAMLVIVWVQGKRADRQ